MLQTRRSTCPPVCKPVWRLYSFWISGKWIRPFWKSPQAACPRTRIPWLRAASLLLPAFGFRLPSFLFSLNLYYPIKLSTLPPAPPHAERKEGWPVFMWKLVSPPYSLANEEGLGVEFVKIKNQQNLLTNSAEINNNFTKYNDLGK